MVMCSAVVEMEWLRFVVELWDVQYVKIAFVILKSNANAMK